MVIVGEINRTYEMIENVGIDWIKKALSFLVGFLKMRLEILRQKIMLKQWHENTTRKKWEEGQVV